MYYHYVTFYFPFQFSFTVFQQIKEEDVKMLKFSFSNFGTDVCTRTFDMSANVYLGGILLESFEFLCKY